MYIYILEVDQNFHVEPNSIFKCMPNNKLLVESILGPVFISSFILDFIYTKNLVFLLLNLDFIFFSSVQQFTH